MSSEAIATHALTRRFGGLLAVDTLDLRVPSGSVTAFLGANGAGKTTTIRMLLGLLRPDGGTVRLFGRELEAERESLLRRVGALVETPALYPHLSGRENLEITRLQLGVARSRLDKALTTVGLTEHGGRPARDYSLGMRQRLGLALSLLGEPDLLILDEPTNGLDPAGIREMRALIRALPREHGVTVFLSSHLLAEVEQVCDHLAVLQRGRCIFQGTLAELRAARHGGLAVGVDRPDAAAVLLRRGGFDVVEVSGSLRIESASRDRHAEICRRLVEAGFAVHHLAEVDADLESSFLELTGDAEGER